MVRFSHDAWHNGIEIDWLQFDFVAFLTLRGQSVKKGMLNYIEVTHLRNKWWDGADPDLFRKVASDVYQMPPDVKIQTETSCLVKYPKRAARLVTFQKSSPNNARQLNEA